MMNLSLPQAYIQFVSGPLAQQVFPLSDQEIWIGSHPRNHIVVPDQSIQPWHARLAWDRGRLHIQSYQDSSLSVNRKSVPGSIYILNGDEVSLGQAGIVFRLILDTTLQKNDTDPEHLQSDVYAATLQSGSHATPLPNGNDNKPPQDKAQVDFPKSGIAPASPRDESQVDFPQVSPAASAQDDKTLVPFRMSGAFPSLLSNRHKVPSAQKEAQTTISQSSASVPVPDEMTLVPFHRSGVMPRITAPQNSAIAPPAQDEMTFMASRQSAIDAPPQQNGAFGSFQPLPQQEVKTVRKSIFSAFGGARKGTTEISRGTQIIDVRSSQRGSSLLGGRIERPSGYNAIPGRKEVESGAPMHNAEQFEAYSSSANIETTRYLCAAAHTDEKFRRFVLKHIVREAHRDLGEAYGVDIVPVVKWCFAAQNSAARCRESSRNRRSRPAQREKRRRRSRRE